MTDNTKMVDLPWIDGTTSIVPEWTVYVKRDGYPAFARDGGYSCQLDPAALVHVHRSKSKAVRILTEAPEPPVKVDAPQASARSCPVGRTRTRPFTSSPCRGGSDCTRGGDTKPARSPPSSATTPESSTKA